MIELIRTKCLFATKSKKGWVGAKPSTSERQEFTAEMRRYREQPKIGKEKLTAGKQT
jgi:hypothetical protein